MVLLYKEIKLLPFKPSQFFPAILKKPDCMIFFNVKDYNLPWTHRIMVYWDEAWKGITDNVFDIMRQNTLEAWDLITTRFVDEWT